MSAQCEPGLTIVKHGGRISELIEEGVGHGLQGIQAPVWGVLQQLGHLHPTPSAQHLANLRHCVAHWLLSQVTNRVSALCAGQSAPHHMLTLVWLQLAKSQGCMQFDSITFMI